MAIGKTLIGGIGQQTIYDSTTPITWSIVQQEPLVTITTTYPVTINCFSNEGTNEFGSVVSTETFDFTPYKTLIIDYTIDQVTFQAGAIESGRFEFYIGATKLMTKRTTEAFPRFRETVDISAITGIQTVTFWGEANVQATFDSTQEYKIHELTLISETI